MTKTTAFAKLYNMVLRYKEEYERLGPGLAATDLIEDFFDEALGVCEEAAITYE